MSRKILLTLILLLSGLSGISYEILYGRILGGILGDQFAVSSAVLITFLLGIGVGARYAHRLWNRLWQIEALIGIYGIAFVLSRNMIEHLLYNGMGFLPSLAGPVLLGTVLLLFPALLLGCSVPLFAGYLGRMNDGPVFSRVYAIYNLGAAATALLIEFWLIRQFGITGTVIVFGLVNLLAAGLLFLTAGPIASVAPEEEHAGVLPRNHIASLVLVSIASAVFQLFMVKIAEMMFGPFRESFALVLSIILFGIAAGSFLVRRLKVSYGRLMLVNVIGLFLFIVLYRDLLFVYADLYEKASEHGMAIIYLKGVVLLLLMAIPATTFGATIPALLNSTREVAKESGTLLYISSLANVAGFLLMALVLHQYLDYGVQLLVISGLVTIALVVYKWDMITSWTGYRLPLAALLVLLTTAGWQHWRWDEDLLYLTIVVSALAANTGCTSGTCTVEKMKSRSVSAASAAAIRQRLEAGVAHVRFAAVALPARDRQQEIEAGTVGEPRDIGNLVPAGPPPLRHLGDRDATVGVEPEQAELERVRRRERARGHVSAPSLLVPPTPPQQSPNIALPATGSSAVRIVPVSLSVMKSRRPLKAMLVTNGATTGSMKCVGRPMRSNRHTPMPAWATTSPPSSSSAKPSGPESPPESWIATPTFETAPSGMIGSRHTAFARVTATKSTRSCRSSTSAVRARDRVDQAREPAVRRRSDRRGPVGSCRPVWPWSVK